MDEDLHDDEAATEACREVLERAVRRQMVADVPLGAFLSGGIDSSTVVASMVRVASRPVTTFTVRFEDQRYDESRIARKTAERLGTDHREIVVPNAAFEEDDLWRIVDHVGQPFYDSSAIPTYVLCKHVREHVTVALTGDGGDEMFAGYPFFRWGLAVERLGKIPDLVLGAGAKACRSLARTRILQARTELRQIRRAVEAATGDPRGMPARLLSVYDALDLDLLLRDPEIRRVGTSALGRLTALPPEAARWSPLRRLMYYRIRNNLARDMLTKVDSMSMACSLELRAPMLDAEVAGFAARLPDHQLLRHGRGKHILRQAMGQRLPREIFEAPKSGFSVPLHRYLNDAFYGLVSDLLGPDGPLRGIVHQPEVEAIIRRARDTERDAADISLYRASHQLWSLAILAAWAKRFEVELT